MKPEKITPSIVVSIIALLISALTFLFQFFPQINVFSDDYIAKAEAGHDDSQIFLANHYFEIGDISNSVLLYDIASQKEGDHQARAINNLASAMLCPLSVQAATPLDPAKDTSLTLHYQKEEQAFSDLQISIYRVAEAFPDGTFELIEPFSSYPINIHDITVQEQWKHTAVTINAYIVANQLMPYREATTNDTGTAVFEHLETGLYLVSEVVAENNSGTYIFDQFMVYLPTPQPDGSFDYDVEAKPKCVDYVPKTEYRVTKLWQDAGGQDDRPEEITVDIYKNGELWETQLLDASNNWSYVWYVSDGEQSNWAVAERSVPEKYNVTVQKNGGTFSIINTHKSIQEIPDGPQTGDSSNITLYIMLMCISGIMLIVLGKYNWRRNSL